MLGMFSIRTDGFTHSKIPSMTGTATIGKLI